MAELQKKALIEQLALQRSEMTTTCDALQRELSLSHQLGESLRNHPGQWAAAGAGTAFLLARLARRKKIIYTDEKGKHGVIFRTSKLIFSLARPALTTFALKYAKDYLEAHFGPFDDNSKLGGSPQK
jgi:hypothetical protein|tara:strand:+ start:1338 stop:1718 length:381 start_codon:yes stop_codon:yes gene_type:complete